MFIHYLFLILYGFIVVFSLTINDSNLRIRRDFLRENTINNNEDHFNLYGNDDDDDDNNGRYLQDDIDREYYLPLKRKFKIKNNHELFEDSIDHNENELNTDKRYMQNDDEDLINQNRFYENYDYPLKKLRNRYGKKSLI